MWRTFFTLRDHDIFFSTFIMWRIFPLDIFSPHLSCGEISPCDRFSLAFSCGEIFHLTDLSPHSSCDTFSPHFKGTISTFNAKFLHVAEFFSSGTACVACDEDKYKGWHFQCFLSGIAIEKMSKSHVTSPLFLIGKYLLSWPKTIFLGRNVLKHYAPLRNISMREAFGTIPCYCTVCSVVSYP